MKSFFKNNRTTALLLAVVAVLLVFSGVRTSRAALTYISDNYTAKVDMPELSIKLVENGTASDGVLLKDMVSISGDNFLKPGKIYSEDISVMNSGNMDAFVRVVVTKYWQNEDGTKNTQLDPSLIGLTLGDGWIVDDSLTTTERVVLYYAGKIAPGVTTAPFVTKVAIDDKLMTYVTEEKVIVDGGYMLYTTFDYNGVSLMLNAEVCAVQTHNAEDAIKSAWGADVTVSGGTLSLK